MDCNITQNGWRAATKLKKLLEEKGILKPDAKLEFYINMIKDMIRGQIRKTNLSYQNEHTDFRGDHYVEAYIVKDEICIAKERIDVPIRN